jgi:hypothetical protein
VILKKRTATYAAIGAKMFEWYEAIWCPEGDLNPHDLAVCGF